MKTKDHKNKNSYKEILRAKMDEYVHIIYKITKIFPKDELYGVTSQIRRAALSIILNYVEGYARKKPLTQLNFYEISYGSLQESKYLLDFSFKEQYINDTQYRLCLDLVEEIGAMLWTEINNLERSQSA